MKLLSEILQVKGIAEILGRDDLMIRSLQFDSRKANPGDLFFAVKGSTSDGHDFISQAVRNGAAAVVCENLPQELPEGVTIIRVNDSRETLGEMASLFYGQPSHHLQLIGVTGTNGKTTAVTLLQQLFTELGYKTGMLSTIRNLINDREIGATHTTPDTVQTNSLLGEMVTEGCEFCFMEISSHAVDQRRIAGLKFRGGIFSNLTHDHLDYHKTFDAYLKAKKSFFDKLPPEAFALVNKDDKNGLVMLQNCQASKYTYSLLSMADFHCKIIENQFTGLHLNMDGQDAWFRLIGSFNAYNLLSVYACAVLLGQDPSKVLTLLSRMTPVDGRFNYIYGPRHITAVVDYAHTPDALKNVLETIRSIRRQKEKIITVVGAGGNRDSAKRPVMASIACNLSDSVILTSDNPRFEDPASILDQMRAGLDTLHSSKVLVIADRLEAIKTAIALAAENDIILVAGKGHETYQEIRGVRYPFDDREILRGLFIQEENNQTR